LGFAPEIRLKVNTVAGFAICVPKNIPEFASKNRLQPLSAPHFIEFYNGYKYLYFVSFTCYICCRQFLKPIFMNKAELIAKVADDAGVTKTQANAALDSFVEAVTKALKKGDKVTLVGFGTFSVSKRAARNGRNPQTGEVIKIKAKKVARFKPGKELSEKI
jgi:DNA-binding protein HU-beta